MEPIKMPESLAKIDGNVLAWALGLVSSFFLGLFGILYHQDKRISKAESNVAELQIERTENPKMTVLSCGNERTACVKHFESELGHGEAHFEALEKKMDTNHTEVKGQLNLILDKML